jgi:short-subunit dehydrogenase
LNLEGRVVVITGASSGIGRAIALEMAQRRMKMVLAARRGDLLKDLGQETLKLGSQPYPLAVDLNTREGAKKVVSEALERFGGVDILVNNAGMTVFGPLEEASDESIERIVSVNLMAPIYATRAAIPSMRQRGGGVIVNISSLAAVAPQPWMSAYSATKAALSALSTSLRIELHPFGIRVIGVHPSYVRTDIEKSSMVTPSGKKLGGGEATSKPGGVVSPERVARAVTRAVEGGFNGNMTIGASARAISFVATHFPYVAKRATSRIYDRMLRKVQAE